MTLAIRTVAFVGIGRMGVPMVRRLIAREFAVQIWNRTRGKSMPLAMLGATISRSPAQATHGADVVCLRLTDAQAVSDVLFGPDGIAAGAEPHQLLVDFSNTGPTETRRLARNSALQEMGPEARSSR